MLALNVYTGRTGVPTFHPCDIGATLLSRLNCTRLSSPRRFRFESSESPTPLPTGSASPTSPAIWLGRPAEQYDAKAISGYMDEQKKVMIQQWVEGQAAILILCPPPDHHTGISSPSYFCDQCYITAILHSS